MNPTIRLITRVWLSPLALCLTAATAVGQPTTTQSGPERADPDPTSTEPALRDPASVAPPNEAAPTVPPSQMPEIDDVMLASVPPPPNVLSDWRQALRLVRARSTSLRAAEIQVTQARVQSQSAANRYHPTVRATGTVNHPLLSPGTTAATFGNFQNFQTTWRGTVSLRQPIVNFQAWHDAGTTELGIEAAQLSHRDAERRVLAAVADSIVSVVTAERLAEVSRVGLRGALSTLDLTQRRARLGAASAVDVLRAQQEVTLLRQQIVSSNENLERAREALGMTLGFAEPWGVSSDIRLVELSADAARVCERVSDVSKRADVMALEKQRQVAERNVQSADYLMAPTLDFTSDYSYAQPVFPADAKPMQWSIGALLTVPLYDGGVRGAQRWQAQTSELDSRNQIVQRTREATMETRQAQRAVEVARRNHEVSLESQRLAREAARLAQLSFVNGRGTSFELVDAARRSREAELDLAVKEFELVRAQLTAELAQANCTF